MKTLKKVQVVPLDQNYATVIDSFNTTDDKTTNAPSINAVEEKLTEINSDISDITDDVTRIDDVVSDINISLNTLNNNVYVKDDYAVLTGTITLSSGSAEITISYPSGFTYQNSVVLSFGTALSSSTDRINFGYGTTAIYYSNGMIDRRITLTSSSITLALHNNISEGVGNTTYSYKLVLLKYTSE